MRLAEKHGLFLILSLTNNWNPRPLLDSSHPLAISARDVTPDTNNTLPRNTLSNDYGSSAVSKSPTIILTGKQVAWMSTSASLVMQQCTMNFTRTIKSSPSSTTTPHKSCNVMSTVQLSLGGQLFKHFSHLQISQFYN